MDYEARTMSDIELGIERQLVYPGELLSGRVQIGGRGSNEVTVSLHGEELFRPYLGFDTILPVFEESVVVRCEGGKGEFSFRLPENLSPSYHSEQHRCAYYLKGIRANTQKTLQEISQGAITRVIPTATSHSIGRLHITVGPPFIDYESAPHTLEIKDENLILEVQVDQVTVEAGDSLTGSFLISRLKDDGDLPKAVVFSLAAIEESTNGKRRAVLWRLENSVQPTREMSYPLTGSFEFPIDVGTPTTGNWNLFKIHCGFRVRLDWGDRDPRESLPIQLCRRIVPQG